jgi:hypothetical protein
MLNKKTIKMNLWKYACSSALVAFYAVSRNVVAQKSEKKPL